jgi:DNA-binding NarL/FixJ family response regulator
VPWTIAVAEELALPREALAALVGAFPECRVPATYAAGDEALQGLLRKPTDIALLDLHLPGLDTVEVVRQLRDSGSATRCIVLSPRADRKSVIDTLEAGARGFVFKSGPGQFLKEAIQQVGMGSIYISPPLDPALIFLPNGKRTAEDPMEKLSAREYQVFGLLVRGLRAKEVAARLEVSPKTVNTYRSTMMKKLGIYDLAGLVRLAIDRGLIDRH